MSGVLVWIGVGLLGGAAAVARVVGAGAIASALRRPLPVGTFVVNVAGALLIGVLAGAGVDGDGYLLAAGGVLGSLTTFSGWMHDSAHHTRRDALLNLAASLVAGFGAVALGHAIGSAL